MAGIGDLRRADEAKAAVSAVDAPVRTVSTRCLHAVGGYAGGTPVAELARANSGDARSALWTTLNIVQAVLPGMIARGWGRIVAVSTPVATNPAPKMAPYAVAKAAEETLLRVVAKEVPGTGVTANLVSVKKIEPTTSAKWRHHRRTRRGRLRRRSRR